MADVLPLSARSGVALDRMRARLADHLEAETGEIGPVAATLQLGRMAMPHRRAVVALGRGPTVAALRAAPPVQAEAGGDGGIVFLFPGQGAQYAGMAAGLMEASPAFARNFARIAEMFAPRVGCDLHDLFVPDAGPGLLAAAQGLQPALFAVELALAQTLIGWGIKPAAVAGHSLGQYVAAVVGGILSVEDGVALVAARALATEQALPGAMVQIAAHEAQVAPLLKDHAGVWIAGVNSTRDVVVAGTVEGVDSFAAAAAQAGFTGQRVAVTRAFHSPMMAGVAEAVHAAAPHPHFAAAPQPNALPVKDGERGCIPVACNVTGGWMSGACGVDYWARHVLAPVRFADNAAAVLAMRPSMVIEVGPGATLTGLVAKASEGAVHAPLVTTMRHRQDRTRSDWEALCAGVARVWETGGDVDWRAFRDVRTVQRVVLPVYPFERRRCWPADDVALTGEVRARLGPQRKLPWQQRFYVPSLRRTSAPDAGAGARQRWVVLDESTELGLAVAKGLRARGHEVICAADGADWAAGEGELRVLCPSPLSEGGDGLARVMGLARELIAARRAVQLFVLADAGKTDVLGPLLSLTQEVPSIVARVIAVDEGVHAADIVTECAAGVPRREAMVSLRGGVRWVERFDRIVLGEAQRIVGERRLGLGPHIITGGLGRIGLALGRHLAGLGADVILVSRSAVSLDDNCGGKLTVVQADVSKAGEIDRVFSACLARHGRIGGVFHAAGLAKVEEIRDVTAASLAEELAPKVAGTEFIAQAIGRLGSQRPDFVMLFSSLAATLGGLGLGSYAAANRFMDGFVALLPVRDGVPWMTVGWDDWQFDYGEQQMGAYAQTRAALSITPEEGFAAIAAILGEPGLHQVLVSVTDLEARRDAWVMRAARQGGWSEKPPEPPALATGGEALSGAEQRVRAAYVRVLGGSPGPDDNFFALGGDSLLATQIVLELSRGAGLSADLRIADVFDFPSIRLLTAKILNYERAEH